MSSLKIALLAIVTASYIVTMTSPNPNPPGHERIGVESLTLSQQFIDRWSWILPVISKAIVISTFLIETIVAYAVDHHTDMLAYILAGDQTGIIKIYISPLFSLGVATVIAGTAIRIACYRELGPFFTFQLSLQPQHMLITTGPYAVVRHPSYTALVAVSVGVMLCELSAGTWWTEAEVFKTTLGRFLGTLWLWNMIYSIIVASKAAKEDAILRHEFGDKWERYAERVKFKFIPGLV